MCNTQNLRPYLDVQYGMPILTKERKTKQPSVYQVFYLGCLLGDCEVFLLIQQSSVNTTGDHCTSACHFGFLRTIMKESPRRNILLMNRSLFTGLAFFFPFPVFGACRNKEICQCQVKTNANKRSRLTPTESTELKMTDNGDLLTTSI